MSGCFPSHPAFVMKLSTPVQKVYQLWIEHRIYCSDHTGSCSEVVFLYSHHKYIPRSVSRCEYIRAHRLELGALAFKSLTVLSRSDLTVSQAIRSWPVPEQITRLYSYSPSFLFTVPVSFFLIFLRNNSDVSLAVLLICRLVMGVCHLAHHTWAVPLLAAHHPPCCSFLLVHPLGKTTHSRKALWIYSCPALLESLTENG